MWAKLCPPLLQKLKRKIKGIRCALNPVSFSNLFAVVFLLVCLFACFVFVFFRFFHFCLFVCLFFASDSFGSPPLSYFDPSQKLAPNAILSAVFSLLYIMNVSNISIYSLFWLSYILFSIQRRTKSLIMIVSYFHQKNYWNFPRPTYKQRPVWKWPTHHQ